VYNKTNNPNEIFSMYPIGIEDENVPEVYININKDRCERVDVFQSLWSDTDRAYLFLSYYNPPISWL
jgi:hypothetical protein